MTHPTHKLASLCLGLMLATTLHADETTEPAWSGRSDFGFFTQSGNTASSTSLSFNGSLDRSGELWRYENQVKALSTRDRRADTGTEYYLVRSKQRRALDADDHAYVQEQFERDSNSAFAHQVSLTAGLGHTFLKDARQQLVLEFGMGARQDTDTAHAREQVFIGTAGGDYRYQLNPETDLRQRVSVETGSDATIARAGTELHLRLHQALGLTLGYDVRRQYAAVSSRLDVLTINLSYSY